MYFLLSGCENPDLLKIIYFIKKIFDIAFILIPIALVVLITIDVFKIMINPDEKSINTNRKAIINRIICAILIFFVPTIVSVLMTLLSNVGLASNEYEACLNVDKTIIEIYQVKQDVEEELEKLNNSNNNSNLNKNDMANDNAKKNNNNTSEKLTTDSSNTEESGNIYKRLLNEMLTIASNEVGYKEGNDNDNKYGEELDNNNVPWCGIFITWVAKNTIIDKTNLYDNIFEKEIKIYNYASATNSIYTFSASKHLNFYYSEYYGGNYTPKAGDIIYFNWTGNWDKKIYKEMHITSGHVGIVEYVEDEIVHTIEGNYNNGVGRASYSLDKAAIMGYGSWYK